MTISIALIDSGINPGHHHVRWVEGGLGFTPGPEGKVVTGPDFSDKIGHGTAIAGIIREKTLNARLYALKIFHGNLYAPASLLLASLKWAVLRNIKIIHLSLGTEEKKYKSELEALCRTAFSKDIVIVAAARSANDRVFPSVFKMVIGVYWNQECNPSDLIYHPNNTIEFGAYGYPRPLPGLPQERNFHGHSFAAARVTARAAQLLEKHSDYTVSDLKVALSETAVLSEISDSRNSV